MSSKLQSQYVNLLHKLAAASVGTHGGDCEIDRVPVSHTPYVVVTVGNEPIDRDVDSGRIFADAERVRRGIVKGLFDHGFHSIAGEKADLVLGSEKAISQFRVFAKKAGDAYRVVTIDEYFLQGGHPTFRVELSVNVDAEHGISYYEQNGSRNEDLRDRFHRMVRDYQEQVEWTRNGMDRIVLALVQGFPFRMSGSALSELRKLSNGDLYDFARKVGAGLVTDEASFMAALGREQAEESEIAPGL